MLSVIKRNRVTWALLIVNAIFLAWLIFGSDRTDVGVALWVVALVVFALIYLAARQRRHHALRREDVRRAASGYTTFGDRQIDDAVDRARTPPPPYLDAGRNSPSIVEGPLRIPS